MLKMLGTISLVLLLSACSQVEVQPVAYGSVINHVCIQKNNQVIIKGFIGVLREGLSRNQISSEVYSGDKPAHCEYSLSYTALQSWDIKSYLSHVELYLYQNYQVVGSAQYHLLAKGGNVMTGVFSPTKWSSNRDKILPVIDQLLGKTL